MKGEGEDVFDILDFDFILVGTELVGEKIGDTPQNDPLGEDWNQLPPLPQEPLVFLPHQHGIC